MTSTTPLDEPAAVEPTSAPAPAPPARPPVWRRALGAAIRPLWAVLGMLWRHGFRFLVVIDAITLYAAAMLINLVRFGTDWPTYPLSHYLVGFAIAVGLQVGVNYFAGLYERQPRIGLQPLIPRVAMAMAIGVGVQAIAYIVLNRYLMPRINLAALFVVGSLVLAGNRMFSLYLANRRRGRSRVFIVGQAPAVASAIAHLDTERHQAKVVGTATSTDNLAGAVRRSNATDVLLLELAGFDTIFPEPLSTLEDRGVGVHQRVSAQETTLGLRSVTQIAGMPFTRLRGHSMASHQRRLKRLFELVVVVATAPLSLLVLALLALWVRLRAGSGVLYRQRRVGAHGTEFEVVKFRTMVPDAEIKGPQLATDNDPRIVRGLGWMRSTRADELPQLWNVLRGQMSLVGPRPERPELVAEISRSTPGYARRHEMPPGITGMAQVYGHYDTSAEAKLGYDLQYLVNWSLLLDIQILIRTVMVVLTRRV